MSSAAQGEPRDGGQMAETGQKVKEKHGFRERYYNTRKELTERPEACIYTYIRGEKEMNAVSSKTFKCGNSIAVRLPKEIAFAPGLEVVIERKGDTLTIRPAVDPAEDKRRLLEMIEALKAIGPPGEIEKREPIYFPRRRGL